jgi:hypothetical protein
LLSLAFAADNNVVAAVVDTKQALHSNVVLGTLLEDLQSKLERVLGLKGRSFRRHDRFAMTGCVFCF